MRILRILAGRQLPCGCLVGTYQLYDDRVVTVIDVRSPGCPHGTHRNDEVLPPEPPDRPFDVTSGFPPTDLSHRVN